MHVDEAELDRLLQLIAAHLDPDRCAAADERYRRTMAGLEPDRPPLVVGATFPASLALPAPWDRFRRYPYHVAFKQPLAMLQNQLLSMVATPLALGDDGPLAIRNDHGTIQVASLMGGSWQQLEDNYPWVEHLTPRSDLEALARGNGAVAVAGGATDHGRATLRAYRDRLAACPPCDELIQISMPDLQGPMDTAELLWGSDLFAELYEQPELIDGLLARVTDTMLAAYDAYRPLASDRLDPVINTQHGYAIPGRLLIRGDSSIMISPKMYREQVMPHDARLLDAVGGGSIHFCGNGQHLIEAMLDIPSLRGLDFGQSAMMDIDTIYALCRPRGVCLTNVQPDREELVSRRAADRFPTGAVLAYRAVDFDDAHEVVRAWNQ